jgi:hypothetical protein
VSRLPAVSCAVALLFVVSACSSEVVSGDPTSAPSAPPPSQTAPLIARPLSVGKLAQDVCSGLTEAQLRPYLGAVRTRKPLKDTKNVPFCGWDPEDGHMADVALYANTAAAGAADLYERRLGDNFFEKVPSVAGYPAVRVSQLNDGPSRGDCMTIVSVSDRERIEVMATTVGKDFQYYTSMCTVTDKLAEAAIENLKVRG